MGCDTVWFRSQPLPYPALPCFAHPPNHWHAVSGPLISCAEALNPKCRSFYGSSFAIVWSPGALRCSVGTRSVAGGVLINALWLLFRPAMHWVCEVFQVNKWYYKYFRNFILYTPHMRLGCNITCNYKLEKKPYSACITGSSFETR